MNFVSGNKKCENLQSNVSNGIGANFVSPYTAKLILFSPSIL